MSRRRDERGFTLVELLAAVAILGIIMVPIGGAFTVGYRTMNDTSSRLAGSTDAQLLTVHFPSDVQSATEAVASTTGAGITCAGAQNPKLQLTDGTMKIVYGVRATGSTFRLERYECTAGAASKTTVVARNIAGVADVVPTRTPASGTFTGASLRLTQKTTGTEPAYAFTVSGRRRANATALPPTTTTTTAPPPTTTTTTVPPTTTTAPPANNGVTVAPSADNSNHWSGWSRLRMTNPSPVTSLTVTITQARTPGLSYHNQWNNLWGGYLKMSQVTTASTITYTMVLGNGLTIVPGTWEMYAQYAGNGTPHPITGDTWSVTSTSGGITSTLNGTF